MDNGSQIQQNSSPQSDEEQEAAVPYTPPPPPEESSQKKMRSPMANALLIALVILLGGFMTYNFVGHARTKLSSASIQNIVTPTPSIMPTVTKNP